MKILLVDDDDDMVKAIADVLTKQQYLINIATDGEMGRQCATHVNYDLILLDVMLPKLDGISVCRQLRQAGSQAPILLLTAKDNATDKVLGLDAGADDYLIKPFDFAELMARIRALLRRGSSSASPILEWGNLCLNPSSCEVTYEQCPVQLTSTEYRLLELFLRHHNRTFSRGAIVDHLWNLDDPPQEATIKSYIKTLRQKLNLAGAPADIIETVYGLGYRLKSLEEQTAQTLETSWIEQQTNLAIQKAKENFKAKLSDRLTILEQTISQLQRSHSCEKLRQQAEHEAHKLAGVLGGFGFPKGSQLAKAIEQKLNTQPTVNQVRSLLKLMAELRQSCDLSSTIEYSVANPLLLMLSDDLNSVHSLLKEAENYPLQAKHLSFPEKVEIHQILSTIAAQNPDAVLLDLDSLPSFQDSLTLLSALSEQPLTVLVWTERELLLDRLEIVRRGVDRFLHKDLSPAVIFKEIAELLKKDWTEAEIVMLGDDSHVLHRMRSRLAASTLKLTTLESLEKFWQALHDRTPDLLILDVEMRHLSSIELCRVIRSDPRWSHLPVLFFTIHTDVETLHQMVLAGANDCVSKSMSDAKLLSRILNCLERNFR
ncbi:response regulator [Pseudanabaenaceae cyanobacterium LEGE 13415]|nr:response regulator [Pseudanabaenaceae cyanobacterium LEGE 13415]